MVFQFFISIYENYFVYDGSCSVASVMTNCTEHFVLLSKSRTWIIILKESGLAKTNAEGKRRHFNYDAFN